jgi:hypothetical protein
VYKKEKVTLGKNHMRHPNISVIKYAKQNNISTTTFIKHLKEYQKEIFNQLKTSSQNKTRSLNQDYEREQKGVQASAHIENKRTVKEESTHSLRLATHTTVKESHELIALLEERPKEVTVDLPELDFELLRELALEERYLPHEIGGMNKKDHINHILTITRKKKDK